nr:reverse transcriptase domain-containing protein [Tanacetum cinerariifolium]
MMKRRVYSWNLEMKLTKCGLVDVGQNVEMESSFSETNCTVTPLNLFPRRLVVENRTNVLFDICYNHIYFAFWLTGESEDTIFDLGISDKIQWRSYFPITSNVTIPRRRQRKQTSNIVEPEFRTIVEMADNRTMAQMLQAPIEGYEDAIVVPPINANNFELKQTLINLVQSNQFTEGEARTWLDKEPPHSILTWEDLVLKFINQFFPPSKTTYLQNEITNFLQKPNETFNEAWERFKDYLRQCPHYGFSELHQLDTFYNALNPNDQDALDSAA